MEQLTKMIEPGDATTPSPAGLRKAIFIIDVPGAPLVRGQARRDLQ